MFCKHCGSKLRVGAHFCGKCGMEVSSLSQPDPMPADPEPLEEKDVAAVTEPAEKNEAPAGKESPGESHAPQTNKLDKKKKRTFVAAALIVVAILIVLFTDIFPKTEGALPKDYDDTSMDQEALPTKEFVYSTPIADFEYTYTTKKTDYIEFENKTYTANPGSVFMRIDLTPVKGKSLSSKDVEEYPFSDTKVVLGNSTYEMHYIMWEWSADGQLTKMVFVFIVDEDKKNQELELVLP